MREICCIKECEKPVMACGMCSAHYRRLRKYGNPVASRVVQYHGLTLKERLMRRMKRVGECWVWTGGLYPKGYGMISVDSRPQLVHRVSWQVHKGPIPDGMMVLHSCDNPPCFRPKHLFLGTQIINMHDMWKKGRANPGGRHRGRPRI